MKKILEVLVILFILSSCSQSDSGLPARLLNFDGKTYEGMGRVDDIESNKNIKYTIKEEVGVIKKTSKKTRRHLYASELEKGSKVYSVYEDEDILIVERKTTDKIKEIYKLMP
ncbi:membrane lipoprotein lipid attachment site-containing protein [Sutcliffiella halmapala]|uniref:membrane lipoprotein lipid attachment site-containing protein n=1 Tax=Sutcliffiella halmapala TaxID=79882 RepID=UPI0009949086|nr:membrane lipoprotein lipid attachment site-containing protein [Sutcliffiella halmapala]